MSKLYFAKLNINSNINDIKDEEIREILSSLFKKLDDSIDYEKIIEVNVEGEDGEEKVITKSEVYNFSQIDKNEKDNNITGWLVKRTPTYTEEFDPIERVSNKVVYKNTAISTMFYFDLNTEIITFCTKNRLGYNQIMEGFEGLFNLYTENIGYKMFLIKNPFTIDETVKKMHKVHKITSTLIPPNAANRGPWEALFEGKTEELKEANITTETTILESSVKNKKGIDKKSNRFNKVIDTIKAFTAYGYAKAEIEGENSKGEKVSYISDKDGAFQRNILDTNKEDRASIEKVSKEGIEELAVQRTLNNL